MREGMGRNLILAAGLLIGADNASALARTHGEKPRSEDAAHHHKTHGKRRPEKPRYRDLVNFTGVDSTDTVVPLQLRQDAYTAVDDLRKMFEHDAQQDETLQTIGGLWVNEALRSEARQKELFKKYQKDHKVRAARPNKNAPHFRGSVVDFREGNSREFYAWMVGGKLEKNGDEWRIILNPDKIPPAIATGWWAPVKDEPWHWEQVGPKKALEKWTKSGKQMVAEHTHHLRALRPIKPKTSPPDSGLMAAAE